MVYCSYLVHEVGSSVMEADRRGSFPTDVVRCPRVHYARSCGIGTECMENDRRSAICFPVYYSNGSRVAGRTLDVYYRSDTEM